MSAQAHKLLEKLHDTISAKKTNLCVAADLRSIEQIVRLVHTIGDHICVLKVHSEGIGRGIDGLEENLKTLYDLKKKYNFLLFEDRKFYDGGETIQYVYEAYAKYVDLVTVVPKFGDAIFAAIEKGAKNIELPEGEYRGCLAVCELSFSGIREERDEYPMERLAIAERNSSICCGIIAQQLNVSNNSGLIKATPGVHLKLKTDGKNQQWRSPEEAILDGADIIIVGRGITGAPEEDWSSIAIQYKERSFRAYLQRSKSKSAQT